MRLHVVGVLLALFACADAGPTAPVLLDGSYLGSSAALGEVRLTLVDKGEALTGTLLFHGDSGRQYFNGYMLGQRIGVNGFEVRGWRDPSVSMIPLPVTVQGTKLPTGELRIDLSDSGQPASTVVLTPQP